MTTTLFTLAFEQAERELGERIGYPALVYEETEASEEQHLDRIDEAKRHMRALIDLVGFAQFYIGTAAHDVVHAARAWLNGPLS